MSDEPLYRLRYVPDTPTGEKFPTIRYPQRQGVSYYIAERMQAAMPNPSAFEIVEDGQ